MKYATLLLGLAIVLASIATARAENTIPAAYRGTWCEISNFGNVREYKRCGQADGEQDWQIQSRRITNGEANCIPLAITTKGKAISVKSECRTNDWNDTVTQDFELSANGQRLLIGDQ